MPPVRVSGSSGMFKVGVDTVVFLPSLTLMVKHYFKVFTLSRALLSRIEQLSMDAARQVGHRTCIGFLEEASDRRLDRVCGKIHHAWDLFHWPTHGNKPNDV